MRHFQLALLCFICVAKSYGQTTAQSYGRIDVEITKEKLPKRIYAKVEIKSAFPGGDSSWVQSIEKSINQSISYKNGAKKGKYIVSVAFVVSKNGSLSDIRCVNDPVGFGMEAVVIRALKKGTKWAPSNDNDGRKVRQYSTSAIIFPTSSIKYKIDSVRNFVPYPSGDLLPPEFTSSSLRNEYYGESDSMSIPTFYRGHVFLLTLRSNCTFIYETFYKPYSYARIEFFIGKYKISGDTISLSYESLLPGKAGEIYMSPTIAVSWRVPNKPNYLLLNKTGLSEPSEQRLKQAALYVQIEGAQVELGSSKCWRH
jgi:hypothetical protein